MKTGLITSDTYQNHNTGEGHPEKIDRVTAVIDNFKKIDNKELIWKKPTKFDQSFLINTHSSEYIDLVSKSFPENGLAFLDGDTVVSPGSKEATKDAVGSIITAIDGVQDKEFENAFCAVRPPGHHAEKDKAMGFCIYNNIAVGANYLINKYKLNKVAIIDFDVHHGNGTQDIFYNDDSIFYFDIHQHPLYPQSGRPNEIGIGKGKGFTLNVDLPKGSGNTKLINAFKNKLTPAMEKFQPEFILVSAGFDSHQGDLLGQLNFTDVGYENIAIILSNIAKKYASGRKLYMLEGGYVAENISKSAEKIIGILTKDMGD